MPKLPMRRMAAQAAKERTGNAVRLILEQFIPYRLSVLTNTVSRDVARMYDERFGLSIPEWRVMAVLGRYEPLSANEVAERTAMDKVRVSRAVSRLLRGRIIQRTTDRSDRRRSQLRLTGRGMIIYRQIVPLALGVEADLLSVLNMEERRLLGRVLAKLQSRAEEIQRQSRTAVDSRRIPP